MEFRSFLFRSILQHPVYPVPYPERFFVRLDMYIARPLPDRIHQQIVYELDYGGFFRGPFEVVEVYIFFAAYLDEEVIEVAHELVYHGRVLLGLPRVFPFLLRAVEPLDRISYGPFRSHDDFDVVTGGELEVIDSENI